MKMSENSFSEDYKKGYLRGISDEREPAFLLGLAAGVIFSSIIFIIFFS